MNLYLNNYTNQPCEKDENIYQEILKREQEHSPISKKNLRHDYPVSIRHYNSLFPNNHIELIDYKNDENTDLQDSIYDLIEAFKSLIHNDNTNEQDILRFINHKPAFFIPASITIAGGFTFGHHDLYLFPEFRLGDKYIADYLLIGSGSGGYEFIFVEFEKSNGRITLKSGHYGEAIRKGNFQIYDWQSWIEANNSRFYNDLAHYKGHIDFPNELKTYDSTRFHYVTVAGLRSDYDEVTYRRRRDQKKKEDIILLHYDNLYDSALELKNRNSF